MLRLQPKQIAAIDSWIAQYPEPRPSRPEAIRRLLETALTGQPAPRTVEEKIATAKRRIAANPPSEKPSPYAGMSTLRPGLAETKLRALKGQRTGKPTPKARET